MTGDLVKQLVDLEEQAALKTVEERLAAGEDPLRILEDSRKAMEIVGKRFAEGECFIPDLVYSGEILKGITEIVKPRISAGPDVKSLGDVVLGTVAGDIHDIGLNIVEFMLDVNGFQVHNLGVDVPVSKFVDEIQQTGARVVALSGFLTLAFDSMKATVEAIEASGLRDGVKIMIGGGQVDDDIKRYIRADAYGKDAMAAVTLAQQWLGVAGKRREMNDHG
ncbi:MAG: cobalamin-dependent protein [Dehalococcoidia bacterium]